MKLVGVQHGPATVTGEQTSTACHCLQSEAERPGVRRDPEVRILRRPHNISDRDEEPEKEAQYAEAWGWFTLGGVLLIIFAVLYCNGALLAPLVGASACANNYLHKVFHDGRHLLGVLAGLVAGLTAGPSPTL